MPVMLFLLALLVFVSLLAIQFYIKFIDERNYNLILQGKLNPYQRKKYFLTLPEKNLFTLLLSIIDQTKYYVVPQLHLSTLLQVKDGMDDLQGKFDWLNKLYVDFVIFDRSILEPKLVIELNDKTHFWNNRKARDQFVGKVLQENHIELLTIFDTTSYEDTKNKIIELL